MSNKRNPSSKILSSSRESLFGGLINSFRSALGRGTTSRGCGKTPRINEAILNNSINETTVNNCHPEPLLWAKDLPECLERICTFAAFWPKSPHSGERARPAATKPEISRQIHLASSRQALRQERLRMTMSQAVSLPKAIVPYFIMGLLFAPSVFAAAAATGNPDRVTVPLGGGS